VTRPVRNRASSTVNLARVLAGVPPENAQFLVVASPHRVKYAPSVAAVATSDPIRCWTVSVACGLLFLVHKVGATLPSKTMAWTVPGNSLA